MKKNFIVDNAVAIQTENHIYDLHNFYDFKQLMVDFKVKEVSLLFVINTKFCEEQVKGKKQISINFSGVDFFELSPDFWNNFTPDLEEVGYKDPGDDDTDWLMSESQSESNAHIFFRLENDHFIRIHSQSAEIIELSCPLALK